MKRLGNLLTNASLLALLAVLPEPSVCLAAPTGPVAGTADTTKIENPIADPSLDHRPLVPSPACEDKQLEHHVWGGSDDGDVVQDTRGANLRCHHQTDHFDIYYNTAIETSSPEVITGGDVDNIGQQLECVWQVYLTLGSEAERFAEPTGSPHLFHDVDRIPVLIKGKGGGNGGGAAPSLALSPFGGNFGCSACSAPGYDTNAIHEFGHVLFKSYNGYFNSGPVGIVNEGLPDSVVRTPLDPVFSEAVPAFQWGEQMDAHTRLAGTSLRVKGYEEGARFWYFLATTYTRMADPFGEVDLSDIPAVCQTYADLIRPAPPLVLRHMLGRDVVKHVQDAFADCHPLGLATPLCAAAGGTHVLDVACAGDPDYPDGCVPRGYNQSGTPDYWKDQPDGVGELFMPLAMKKIDEALERDHGLAADALPHRAFREYLTWNVLRGGGTENDLDPAPPDPAYPQRLKSFGADTYVFDFAGDDAWVIDLEKGPDMPEWAYSIFYVNGDSVAPLDADEWGSDDHLERVVSRRAGYTRAVLIVTAFEGTYRGGAYDTSGGHYRINQGRAQIRITEPAPGDTFWNGESFRVSWSAGAAEGDFYVYYRIDGGPWRLVSWWARSGYVWNHHLGEGDLELRVTWSRDTGVSAQSGVLHLRNATLAVTRPAPRAEWYIGEPFKIEWAESPAVPGNLSIEVTSALHRVPVAAGVPDVGGYVWVVDVPEPNRSYELRVCSDESGACGTVFPLSIQHRGLVMRQPSAHSTSWIGDSTTIQWENHGAGDEVNLYLSRNAGVDWQLIAEKTANDGSYQWTVSGPESTRCLYKVVSASNPAYQDTNDSLFSVAQRHLEVLAPAGGETLRVGDPFTILWKDNFDHPNNGYRVSIFLKHPAGYTLLAEAPNTGAFTWTVPDLVGASNRILVRHPLGPSDVSDGAFTIGR